MKSLTASISFQGMKRRNLSVHLAIGLLIGLVIIPPPPVQAQWTVFDPFVGIGKPEPLKYLLSGAWSRRLTQEHRIVYLVSEERIDFLQGRYHY